VRRPLLYLFGLAAASTLLIVSIMLVLEANTGFAAYAFASSLGVFLVLYNRFVKERAPRYPLAFPKERDAYFPFSDIPRPIHDDVSSYPEYFKREEEREPDPRWRDQPDPRRTKKARR
jgi:hypothetical protein